MSRPRITLSLSALLACSLLLPGCGGEPEAPPSTNVITPAAKEPEPAAVSEAAPAPADEPMPEVAATPTEPEPADTPEPAPAEEKVAEETTSETVAVSGTPQSVTLGAEPGGTTFKGRVTVKGTATEPKPITPSKDQVCIALGEVPDQSLVISDDGGLANVFVWLRKVPSGTDIPPAPEEPAVLDNRKCTFEPHAMVLRVGQTMLVKNSDATGHNTHTSPLRNEAFNQLIGPNQAEPAEIVYGQPEILPVTTKCDIHPWMSSFHFPAEHPWVAITDANGNFEITGLPAGDLTFRMWHERMGYVERSVKVTIGDGESVEKSFEVDAAELAE